MLDYGSLAARRAGRAGEPDVSAVRKVNRLSYRKMTEIIQLSYGHI